MVVICCFLLFLFFLLLLCLSCFFLFFFFSCTKNNSLLFFFVARPRMGRPPYSQLNQFFQCCFSLSALVEFCSVFCVLGSACCVAVLFVVVLVVVFLLCFLFWLSLSWFVFFSFFFFLVFVLKKNYFLSFHFNKFKYYCFLKDVMKKKDFFRSFGRSCNPAKYHRISELQIRHAMGLFIAVFLVSFIIFAILIIPKAISVEKNLQQSFSLLPEAKLNISIHSNEPTTLLSRPKIVVHTSENASIADSFMLFGNDHYYYRFFGVHNGTYNYQADLHEASLNLFKILFFLLIPGILLFLGVFFFIVFLAIIFILSIFTTFFTKAIDFRDVFVIGLHASLLPILVLFLSLPFVSLWFSALIVFLVLFVLGLLQADKYRSEHSSIHHLNSDGELDTRDQKRETHHLRKKQKKTKSVFKSNKNKKKPRQLEIWED